MSILPPPLARRVDRLARHAHAFHRFAHHPLCARYAGEVVRLGRRGRICLGCSLAGGGVASGALLGIFSPAVAGAGLFSASALLALAVPVVVRARAAPAPGGTGPSRADGRRAHPSPRKVLTRFLPAAVAGWVVAQSLTAPSAPRIAASALALAAVGWTIARYRRRGPDRAACLDCPDGPPGARCPGLAPLARRERAFSRLAGRWIEGATRPPPPWPPSPPPPAAPAPAGRRSA